MRLDEFFDARRGEATRLGATAAEAERAVRMGVAHVLIVLFGRLVVRLPGGEIVVVRNLTEGNAWCNQLHTGAWH